MAAGEHENNFSVKSPIDISQLELSGLRSLVALAEEGSLLGAANAIQTSRGTLRRRLAQLEAAVGLPLFTQGSDRIYMTTAGEVLVERSRELFGALRGALAQVHAAADAPIRSLRCLVPDGLPPSLGVSVLSAGIAQSPWLRLELDSSPDPLAADLNAYDLIVHLGAPPDRGFLVTRQLVAVPEILVASKAYLAANGTLDSPEALSGHRLLSWKPPEEPPGAWRMSDGRLLAVEPTVASSDIHLVRHLAYAGLGIARVLEGGVPVPQDAELVRLLPEAFSRTVPLRFLIPEGLHRTPRMRLVVQMLEEMGLGLTLELPGDKKE